MSFYSVAPFIQEYYPHYYRIDSYPVEQSVAFCRVSEPWGVFSNFAPTPLIYECTTFRNTEQLFQLMKFQDEHAVRSVYAANNPKMSAKHWEKKYRRNDWGQMIVDAMKFCLQLKFKQSQQFREALNASKGKYIVEDQTTFRKKYADTWGVKREGEMFTGPNLMGKLLMELRDAGRLEYTLPADAFESLKYLNRTD